MFATFVHLFLVILAIEIRPSSAKNTHTILYVWPYISFLTQCSDVYIFFFFIFNAHIACWVSVGVKSLLDSRIGYSWWMYCASQWIRIHKKYELMKVWNINLLCIIGIMWSIDVHINKYYGACSSIIWICVYIRKFGVNNTSGNVCKIYFMNERMRLWSL